MAAPGVGHVLASALSFLVVGVSGQAPGKYQKEMGIPMQTAWCTHQHGCCMESGHVTLDANWRWLHEIGKGDKNCFNNGQWVHPVCSSPASCAHNCALEGLTAQQYLKTYGIKPVSHGIQMTFTTKGEYGTNYGSRVYLTEQNMDHYKLFKLKNREISFTVDAHNLPCGLNGALYLVEMPQNGGYGGLNKAGAKYGTGYCDAQCPNDIKFSEKGPNVKKEWGMCCPEVDLWEANSLATSFSMHPCQGGRVLCKGDASCGYGSHRQTGKCDKDGCDYNPYRLGKRFFYGHHRALDSTKPITVITQFITKDGTDHGDLSEVRRLYMQNGKVIQNEHTHGMGMESTNSMTDQFCSKAKHHFKDPQTFAHKGGLAKLGKSLDRGMVLAMSIWDDAATGMLWLDGTASIFKKPGAKRGPCPKISSNTLRTRDAHSSVLYANLKFGHINSTMMGGTVVPGRHCSAADLHSPPPPPPRTMTDVLEESTQEYTATEAIDRTLGGAVKRLRRPLPLAGLACVAAMALAALGMRVWQSSKRSTGDARNVVDAAPGQNAETQLLVQ